MTVLGEEILKSMHGTGREGNTATHMASDCGPADGSVRVKMVESEGGDNPNHPHVHLFPQPDAHVTFHPHQCTFPSMQVSMHCWVSSTT